MQYLLGTAAGLALVGCVILALRNSGLKGQLGKAKLELERALTDNKAAWQKVETCKVQIDGLKKTLKESRDENAKLADLLAASGIDSGLAWDARVRSRDKDPDR